jgi:hypothetical protein
MRAIALTMNQKSAPAAQTIATSRTAAQALVAVIRPSEAKMIVMASRVCMPSTAQ